MRRPRPRPSSRPRSHLTFADAVAERLALAERLLEATPRSATADLRRATALVSELAVSRPRAPKLPLNRPISANRSYALTQTPLADVKAAAKTSGGTVNDVILAAVTGMLAHWLVAASVDPASLPRDPVALVPVSIRGKGEEQTTGNRISIVFVDLPVGEPDPQRRVKLLNERMTAIKGSAKVAAGSVMVDLGGAVPPLLSSIMARVPGADGGAFNLVVSNVPGPQFPMYLNGSRVVAVHPAVPLNPADQGLNVGVFSYDGRVCFGLMADRNLTPDVSVALAGLEAALAEQRLQSQVRKPADAKAYDTRGPGMGGAPTPEVTLDSGIDIAIETRPTRYYGLAGAALGAGAGVAAVRLEGRGDGVAELIRGQRLQGERSGLRVEGAAAVGEQLLHHAGDRRGGGRR